MIRKIPRQVESCFSKVQFIIDNNYQELPIDSIVVLLAKKFIGTEYKANTLRNIREEKLIVNLEGVDCYTFVEAVVALARTIKLHGDFSPEVFYKNFLTQIENIRYRNGVKKTFASRLHYFSEWIFEMDKRGIVKNITSNFKSVLYDKQINFMTKNFKFYPELIKYPEFIDSLKIVENNLNNIKFNFIPQSHISEQENKFHSGDIVGITTNIKGLDISHVGMIIKKENKAYLIHAPNVGKKVQISKRSIGEYILSNKHQTGIIICRVLEPH